MENQEEFRTAAVNLDDTPDFERVVIPDDSYDATLVGVEVKIIETSWQGQPKKRKFPIQWEIVAPGAKVYKGKSVTDAEGGKVVISQLLTTAVKKGSSAQFSTSSYNLLEMAGLVEKFRDNFGSGKGIPEKAIIEFFERYLVGKKFRVASATINKDDKDTTRSVIDKVQRLLDSEQATLPTGKDAAPADEKTIAPADKSE